MAEIGGIVVIVEEPRNDRHEITHCVPEEKEPAFIRALLNLRGCKQVEGPLINGIWAVTFQGPLDRPLDKYCQIVQARFDYWAKPNFAVFGETRP